MPKIKRIDHIAIVVEDLQNALGFWQQALGLTLEHVEEVPEQLSEIAFLPAGGSEVELVRPTTGDSGIARYLQKRGPGIHHICFEVEDIDAEYERLRGEGVVMTTPIETEEWGERFFQVTDPNGVVIQLVQWVSPPPEGAAGGSL